MKIPKQTGKLIFPQLCMPGLLLGETARCQPRKVVIIILAATVHLATHSHHTTTCATHCLACGKSTREQLSNFENTTAATALLPCSQSQHTISTNFIFSWRATRRHHWGQMFAPLLLPKRDEASPARRRPPPSKYLPRVSRPVQVGKCYKVERNEESAPILCFTAVPSVRARMEVPLYFYHARSTHSDQAGRHTSTTYAAGHGHRIVSCYCYNKGEPDCCLVFHLWHFRLHYTVWKIAT